MTLTVGSGPFGHRPAGSFNLEIPFRDRLLYMEPSPRRIRAELGGETVVDTTAARLVYEQGRLPIYYFPEADVRTELLEPTDQRTNSPIVGEARWWTLRAGGKQAENAAWAVSQPTLGAEALEGLIGLVWGALDRWLEEDEEVIVHPRDPYHRIDVMPTSRHVRVCLDGELLAETRRARVLFETGLPPRWYIPADDLREELLQSSELRTGCAYKGYASYRSVEIGGRVEDDLVWTYPEPRPEAAPIAGYLCFFNERVDLEIDGEPQERPLTQWSPGWKGR
jgi:uncharacterized protein (DUF427 family)